MPSRTESDLPTASSPALILTHPTAPERRKIWSLSHPKWGTALTLDEYLHREEYLMTVPVAKGGGIAQWILTDRRLPPDERPILSSCETLRKRAFVAQPAGNGQGSAATRKGESVNGGQNGTANGHSTDAPCVTEAIAHGIGSVFTDPVFRGRGYASRMMELLGEKLKTHQGRRMEDTPLENENERPPVAFTVLFSDIGKKFYATRGWAAFPSTHFSFTPQQAAGQSSMAKKIGYHELAELCAVDEKLLKEKMGRESLTPGNRTCVALSPDLDAMLWHLMREDFVTTRIFERTPSVRGGVFGEPGRRVWAIWTRSYTNRPPVGEGNTLHILRFVIEDTRIDAAYLSEGVRAVLEMARTEAWEWQTAHVELWNPTPQLASLVEGVRLGHKVVEREIDSIPSLMWYGYGCAGDVDWVANEKYAWY